MKEPIADTEPLAPFEFGQFGRMLAPVTKWMAIAGGLVFVALGDTVIAAFALGLASGLIFAEASRLANHAGGVVVMKKGTATVNTSELLASLDLESKAAASNPHV